MSFVPGQSFGSYRISSRLGAGGMGEVWRATDTRLGRDVALKVLPPGLDDDPDRHARFEREARALAALNHSNIAILYDVEHLDGRHVLVMELVDGEDLAQRLLRGPIPVDEAVAIARQIAEALEAAHEKGIVHRDLKPANVTLTPDGTVKVLDFGLAKALLATASGSGAVLADSPTITHEATRAGLLLGTAGYMSPEQARGKAVDRRTDVWALGVVLFEMLTGRSLFGGETVSDTLAAVLRQEIDWHRLPAETPAGVRRVLRRCLERDVRIELEQEISDAPAARSVAATSTGRGRPSARERIAWTVAAVGVVAAVVALGLVLRGAPAASQPTTRFRMLPAEAGEIEGYPALSPDGRTLAYVVQQKNGSAMLCSHSFDTGTSRQLPGTNDAQEPFFSPDGRQVAFFAKGLLKRLDLATGVVREIGAVADSRGGAWMDDGNIIATVNSASPLIRISTATGESAPLTALEVEQGAQSHRFPWPLPGGRFLFTVTGSPGVRGIYWASPGTSEPRRIVAEPSRAAYDERGYLLWVRQGALVAQPFDAETGRLSGEPFPLADHVGSDRQKTGKNWFATSSTGVVAYRSGDQGESQLLWFDRGGRSLGAATSPAGLLEPALSPDNRRIAVCTGPMGSSGDIWLFDAGAVDRGQRLTFGPTESETPVWSPDGRWLAYSSARARGYALFRKAADGSGDEEHLLDTVQPAWPCGWTPDGRQLLFEQYGATGGSDLWLLQVDGQRKAAVYLATGANESHAAISPDGRLVAYVSDQTGVPQVYIQALPLSGSKWQLTSEGGDMPAWRSDGREIYYVGPDRVLRAVPIVSLAPFAAGPPVELFRLRTPQIAITGNRTYFAAAADGQRILVNSLVGESDDPGIGVVMNWLPPVAGAGAR